MSETNVPAAEAEREAIAYELAFHVLPTVAEGEVASVVDTIKSHITAHGGTVTSEEAPARFELAYEIIKHLEGRNRKFTSAYFGWIRFTAEASTVEELMSEVEGMKEILRSLLIRLNKVEEANQFMFHESIKSRRVETIDVEEALSGNDDEDGEADDGEEAVDGDTETADEDAVDGEDDK
jgi:ribosomal protein S6